MKKKTAGLIGLDKNHVWHPFTQMREWEASEPLVIERGQGSYLIDTEGRRYLDGVSSLWVNVHGHRKREVDRAIKEQLGRIAHSTLLGLANVPSIELAERLVKVAPKGLKRVFYSDNGSTSVEIALKMAFQFWEETGKPGKKRFVAFTGAYHGDTFGSMSVGEIDIFVKKYRPLLFRPFRAPYPYCYRCPVKAKKTFPDCKTACLKAFEEVLKKHHKEIAACVIEPLLQGAAGVVVSPPGFLKEVRRLTKKYNVLLIADEVATGFGRTGHMFACDAESVSPDFLCLAKGLTGGYLPLAATLTTDRVYKAFLGRYEEYKSFFHGHTYTGNPLGCAAAIANLEIFEKEKVLMKLAPKIALFKRLLERFENLNHVGDVRQLGLVAGIELVKDKRTKEAYPARERVGYRACLRARGYGVILRPLGDVVVLMPPLSATRKEIQKIADAAYRGIREITEGAKA
ncbi:adenosylmethionine--8-amino-7-oxononanoate transaminase [bacterium]|nr:adenosylmethionine--8-amino-7-oxononanoate transaminase [bacterium]